MPLSSDEERIFKEMEDSLFREEKTTSPNKYATRRNSNRSTKIVIGVLVIVVGIVGLILGVALKLPLIGLVGFIAMFAGVYVSASDQFDARKR